MSELRCEFALSSRSDRLERLRCLSLSSFHLTSSLLPLDNRRLTAMAATVLINNLVANATTLFEQTGAVATISKHTGVDLAMLYASFVTFMHDTGVAQRAVYDTIDYSSLNFVEQLWFRWYSSWSNPIIATGVMAFVMHEVSCLAVHSIALQTLSRALQADRVQPMGLPTRGPS